MNRILALVAALFFSSSALALTCTGPYCFEAENATRKIGLTTVNTTTQGNSGTGYVTSFDNTGDRFEYDITAPTGLYELWVGYRVNTGFGDKGYKYRVGSTIGTGTLEESGIFKEDRAGLFSLTGGPLTIGIEKDWGFHDIDYMQFRPFTPPAILPVSTTLSDPNADQNTQLLMNYLTGIYGQKTLAGHQHDESKNLPFPSNTYLNLSGGLKPAIRSSDFMEYSPTRLQFGANPRNETEQTRDWAKANNGIVSMTWHWNAPADLVNTPCGQSCGPNDYPWWRGFYTQGTTFNLPAALADHNSSGYQAILRDIDAIAVELQKFEDAGVPVIWRPLHEAQGNANGTSGSGAWFWWGAHGPGPFKELWRLMHDRLTNEHGLHNLIWEFTSSAAKTGHEAWYPGDDVVDMIGLDIYTTASDNMSGPWYDILNVYNSLDPEKRKLIALSESGTLPNATAMETYGIAWNYFSMWKDGFLDDFSAAQVQALLNDDDIITLNELPGLPWANAALPLGDYSKNSSVDASDYVLWRHSLSQAGYNLTADGDLNGIIQEADYNLWASKFGNGSGGGSDSLVPEPASLVLLVWGAVFMLGRRRGV